MSGPPAAIASIQPLLDIIGRRTHVVGDAHQARVVKLCVNLVLAVLVYVALDLTPAFTAEGQRKDLRLALQLAAEHELPLPQASATEVEFSRLIASGLGQGHGFASLILLAARDARLAMEPEHAQCGTPETTAT